MKRLMSGKECGNASQRYYSGFVVLSFCASMIMSTTVLATELTIKGSGAGDNEVRGFEDLSDPSTSGGPILLQTSNKPGFGAPSITSSASCVLGSCGTSPVNENLFFLGIVDESNASNPNGDVYQYIFNQPTFCITHPASSWIVRFEANNPYRVIQRRWISCT